ncbi:odorant receptor 33a [Microplitis demolitor]|uniref:odorant receptor 33a n=1 Tax=Microplitis demolitor TaxID=69319 RepID=UPI0004CD52FA|nr:odorant receptor 33a [Microplitis demolitor]
MTLIESCWMVFTWLGLFRPTKWKGLKARIYDLYTASVLFFNYSFFICGVMDIDFTHLNFFADIDLITLMLQYIENTPKILCMILSRNALIEIDFKLQNDHFKLKDEDEKKIQSKFDKFSRYVLLAYSTLQATSLVYYTTGRILAMESPVILPYRSRIPFNYSSSNKIYMLTALDQLYSVSSLICINGAFNLVFTSTMYQICTKIRILKHRFKVIIQQLEHNGEIDNNDNKNIRDVMRKNDAMTDKIESQLIANWVESHIALINLYDYAKCVFAKAVFIHYVINSIVMCTLAYILSHCEVDNIFFGNVCYFSVKCTQQFLQCSSAHQITLEFEDLRDMIFSTNWFATKINIQKSIIIIMSKSIVPIEFVSGYFVTLSLDSFKRILKLSYTIYNVLEG